MAEASVMFDHEEDVDSQQEAKNAISSADLYEDPSNKRIQDVSLSFKGNFFRGAKIYDSYQGRYNLFRMEWYSANKATLLKVAILMAIIIAAIFLGCYFLRAHFHTITDHCAGEETCFNGGTCHNQIGSFSCICPSGFQGDQCQTSSCSASERSSPRSLITVNLDCGGLITVPTFSIGSNFLVDFKSNITYKNNEQCMWTFNTSSSGSNYEMKVRITLLCEGFLSSGGALSVYNWRQLGGDMILSRHALSKNTGNYWATTSDRKLFLAYAPGEGYVFESGFLALVEMLYSNTVGSATDVFKTTPGNLVFSPATEYNYFSIIVNLQQATTTFTVNYLDSKNLNSCSDDDTLDVYEIRPKSSTGFKRVLRLCGNVISERSHTSAFPFLATFRTYRTKYGRGFKLTWE